MSSLNLLRRLARKCNHISAGASDQDGFVSVQSLLEEFRTELTIRPLLVEAMLASSEERVGESVDRKHKWCVLVDSETFGVSGADVVRERMGSTLPARFRSTVAHELTHSLAFRTTEFGVDLPPPVTRKKTRQKAVAQTEAETWKLAPLLLLAEPLLDQVFLDHERAVSIDQLRRLTQDMGISRTMLVNRLKLLELVDERRLLNRPSLINVAVGLGKWRPDGKAVFESWPYFDNFEGGKVPWFAFELQKGNRLLLEDVFPDRMSDQHADYATTWEATVDAGTPSHPSHTRIRVRCSLEPVQRVAGREFLFAVHSLV